MKNTLDYYSKLKNRKVVPKSDRVNLLKGEKVVKVTKCSASLWDSDGPEQVIYKTNKGRVFFDLGDDDFLISVNS